MRRLSNSEMLHFDHYRTHDAKTALLNLWRLRHVPVSRILPSPRLAPRDALLQALLSVSAHIFRETITTHNVGEVRLQFYRLNNVAMGGLRQQL